MQKRLNPKTNYHEVYEGDPHNPILLHLQCDTMPEIER
jgi:hypothetical protein